jgi:CBS-domain-containing membrane protein
MQRIPLMQRYRNATWKTWLGAALVVWLLLAESFALAHQYSLGHANSPDCAVCVGAASFGAAAVSAPVRFEPVVAASFIVVAAGIVLLSVVPARRYARGPPAVSFTF